MLSVPAASYGCVEDRMLLGSFCKLASIISRILW